MPLSKEPLTVQVQLLLTEQTGQSVAELAAELGLRAVDIYRMALALGLKQLKAKQEEEK
jgi:hypothetical protein